MQQPIDDKKDTVVIRAVSQDEEGQKTVEKFEVDTHNVETLKHVHKKLIDKGIQKLQRHPVDGLPISRGPPKSGHGGKYTWEGPTTDYEMADAPAVLDEGDPNYVDEEEEEEKLLKGEGDEAVAAMVVGAVEVPKVAEGSEGVSRLQVDPQLNV